MHIAVTDVMVGVLYWPLLAIGVVGFWFATNKDSYFLLPTMLCELLLAALMAVDGQYWFTAIWVLFFLVTLVRAILVWDTESKTVVPPEPHIPEWAKPSPSHLNSNITISRYGYPPRSIGYHRPESVAMRTGAQLQIES